MRLLVTAPLNLDPKVIAEKIKEFMPPAQHLIMTEEFQKVYGIELLPLVAPGNCHALPLELRDFDSRAISIRQIEMIHLSTAILVISPTVSQDRFAPPEPNVNLPGLINLASKNHLHAQVIEV
jgi:hypothetical protein